MLFAKSRNIPLKLNIVIDNESIGGNKENKSFGVFIDNILNWKDRISYISRKITWGIGMIIKARNYLNQDALLALYHAFIYPYFTYCNHVWGATYESDLQRLVILQNRIVRIISRVKSTAVCKLVWSIRYYEAWIYQLSISTFHVPNMYWPNSPLFKPLFQINQELHNYSTSTADHFHIPLV